MRKIAKFLVMHYGDQALPELNEDELDDVWRIIHDELEENPEVEFKGTWTDENGVGVSVWEAPEIEPVEWIVDNQLKQPNAEIVAVERLL